MSICRFERKPYDLQRVGSTEKLFSWLAETSSSPNLRECSARAEQGKIHSLFIYEDHMKYATTETIQSGIPGTSARVVTLVREPVAPDHNQLELFRTTCGPDEYEYWTEVTLELLNELVMIKGRAIYPSEVYAACARHP
jgi:hypothetical protein